MPNVIPSITTCQRSELCALCSHDGAHSPRRPLQASRAVERDELAARLIEEREAARAPPPTRPPLAVAPSMMSLRIADEPAPNAAASAECKQLMDMGFSRE